MPNCPEWLPMLLLANLPLAPLVATLNFGTNDTVGGTVCTNVAIGRPNRANGIILHVLIFFHVFFF